MLDAAKIPPKIESVIKATFKSRIFKDHQMIYLSEGFVWYKIESVFENKLQPKKIVENFSALLRLDISKVFNVISYRDAYEICLYIHRNFWKFSKIFLWTLRYILTSVRFIRIWPDFWYSARIFFFFLRGFSDSG